MKTTFNTGNFSLAIEGEPTAEVLDSLIESGVKAVVQRDVASKAYVEIAGVAGKKAGSKVLPDKFERDSIKYSEEAGMVFADAFAGAMKKYGNFSVVVTESVGGETETAMVRASNLVDTLLAKNAKGESKEADLRFMLGSLYGMENNETATRDEMVAFAHGKGLGMSMKKAK